MKEYLKSYRLFVLIAALCTLAAAWLVIYRIRIEEPQKQIAVVTSWDDIELMKYFSDIPEEEWLAALKAGGLQAVMVPVEQLDDERITKPILDAGLEIAQVGGEADGGIYFFATKYDSLMKPRLSDSVKQTRETLPAGVVLPSIEESGSTLVLVENIMQTSSFVPRNYRLIHYEGNTAKCFWLNKAFACRYATLGYSGYEELVNMMFRAVIDRGMTVIWISPISDNWSMVNDPAAYTNMLKSLQSRIAPAGYTFGDPDAIPAFGMSPVLLAICGIGIMAACMTVLALIRQPKRRWIYWALFALLAVESVAAPFMFMDQQMQLLALLAAMAFPALAVLLLAKRLKDAPVGRHATVTRFAVTLLSCLAIVLWGCLYISAVQTTSLYLLVMRLFRGVKLSQLGVYGFSALVMAWVFLHHKGNSLRRDILALFPKDNRRVRMQTITAIAVVVIAGAVYVLRSGDGMLSVPTLEQRIRNTLETVLLYRPRTKEFLIAFPAIAAAFVFAARGNRVWTALFGVLGGIGFASVANTFCHMRAHFTVSLYRTLLSIAIGLILGILITLIARLWRIDDSVHPISEKE